MSAVAYLGLPVRCNEREVPLTSPIGSTPFYPRSPYAVAKQYAYWQVINYREAYGAGERR